MHAEDLAHPAVRLRLRRGGRSPGGEREPRVSAPPEKAPKKGWPAIRIQLADPDGGRFEFSSECRQKRCRIKESRLLSCYRSYLDGKACRFR
ncbi:MAG: hypothetical protein QM805_25150 [Pseudomonas sp.]